MYSPGTFSLPDFCLESWILHCLCESFLGHPYLTSPSRGHEWTVQKVSPSNEQTGQKVAFLNLDTKENQINAGYYTMFCGSNLEGQTLDNSLQKGVKSLKCL